MGYYIIKSFSPGEWEKITGRPLRRRPDGQLGVKRAGKTMNPGGYLSSLINYR
jgi:hypothetical protein